MSEVLQYPEVVPISYELDLLKDKRNLTALRTASYKRRSERYFNSKVKEKRFKGGDLVLRKVLPNMKEVNADILGPNWEGPYSIVEVLRPGTYRLKRLDNTLVPRSWNAELLMPYYQQRCNFPFSFCINKIPSLDSSIIV